MINKLIIASDHAGVTLKETLIKNLTKDFLSMSSSKFILEDLGTNSEASVDYPDYAKAVCQEIIKSKDPKTLGVLICGSGQGMAMSANKFKEIRAALCWSEAVAKLSRQHNNANVLCLSSREIDEVTNYKILKTFLTTSFEGGRHQARLDKL
jgi:ribose 5-phosphate isomerase B